MSKKKERNRLDMQSREAEQEKEDFIDRDLEDLDEEDEEYLEDEDIMSDDEGFSSRSRTDKDERLRELERENKE